MIVELNRACAGTGFNEVGETIKFKRIPQKITIKIINNKLSNSRTHGVNLGLPHEGKNWPQHCRFNDLANIIFYSCPPGEINQVTLRSGTLDQSSSLLKKE